MNVGNKITQKPHSSWVSFYPIIQLFFRCGIPYFCKKTVLFYKHGIAKTEKTIFFFYCGLIGCQYMFSSGKCGYKHYQCGFRQMEISDQCIDDFELISSNNQILRSTSS